MTNVIYINKIDHNRKKNRFNNKNEAIQYKIKKWINLELILIYIKIKDRKMQWYKMLKAWYEIRYMILIEIWCKII